MRNVKVLLFYWFTGDFVLMAAWIWELKQRLFKKKFILDVLKIILRDTQVQSRVIKLHKEKELIIH